MKKIVLFLVLITSIIGCSFDDNDTYTYHILPVESYILPESFTLGETYEIKLKYQKPNPCHVFRGIYFLKDSNIRTIAVQTVVKDGEVCIQELPPISEVSLNFIVNNTGSYIFKFYKGKDTKGEDVFEEVEIPVVQQ